MAATQGLSKLRKGRQSLTPKYKQAAHNGVGGKEQDDGNLSTQWH